MTLEEAFHYTEDKATDLRATADYYKINGSDYIDPEYIDECEKCAEEYAQLAEWLKDYKRLLETVEIIKRRYILIEKSPCHNPNEFMIGKIEENNES